jgi:hypothetical protein
VEHCLERCTDRDNNAANFMNAYTGLRFICKERKQEFFDALPCLSEFALVSLFFVIFSDFNCVKFISDHFYSFFIV